MSASPSLLFPAPATSPIGGAAPATPPGGVADAEDRLRLRPWGPSSGYIVVDRYWHPSSPMAGEFAACRIGRCRYQPSVDPHTGTAGAGQPAPCAPPPGPLPGLPAAGEFGKPQLIIWYQKTCVACQNSTHVFDALVPAAAKRGFTVHLVEAVPPLLQAFPHVTMVPMYDLVTPTTEPGACSRYGPGTTVKSLRNDVGALRAEFPDLVLSPPGGGARA